MIQGEAPDARLAPGAVARCVLYGMFALNSRLRVRYPQLARDLLEEEYRLRPNIRWPQDLSLKLGLCDPRMRHMGLAAGSVWALRVLGAPQWHGSFADIVWWPLTWSLVPAQGSVSSLAGRLPITEDLPDVSEWLFYGPDRTNVDLRNVVRRLPAMSHPLLNGSDDWLELYPDMEAEHPAVIVFGRRPC